MAQDTQLMANAIRALAMDAVQQANSGHPGAPMGMADIAVALWARHLRHNPSNPHWPDRDRFVLSNGHGSMLIYALLHLTGYALPIDELRNFRKLHSKTPGHPEVGITPGVETTTGPLGQGISNAVGMALAEQLLAGEFNKPGHAIVDHHTYVFLGDGCLMEGISHEACSLAGTLKLSKLIAIYDDNGISIDGEVKHWFADDTPRRFEAYGWNVIRAVDGHNVDAVDAALTLAKTNAAEGRGPTLICARTLIGKGSPNRQNTAKAHGEALGADEIALTRAALGWPHAPFEVPSEAYAAWSAVATGSVLERNWLTAFEAYGRAYPLEAAEFMRRTAGDLPASFGQTALDAYSAAGDKAETVATRKASQLALETFTAALPELLGGSADLTGSNLTNTKATPPLRLQATEVSVEAAKAGTDNAFTSHLAQAVGEAVKAVRSQAQIIANESNSSGSKLGTMAFDAVTGTLMDLLKGAPSAAQATANSHTQTRYSLNAGRHINYGVREFGMAAIMNGAALHGGLIPYGGTFLTFSDYSRNAIRMAALMRLRVVHVFTHDSIGLGEDGPTHQSIEHAASLRLIPNLNVWRPADTQETVAAWVDAIVRKTGPSALLLSRQNCAFLPKNASLEEVRRGGYVLAEPSEVGVNKKLQAVIIATGSEVQLALHAQSQLAAQGVAVRVVSMPCTNEFDRQSSDYKQHVLPKGVPRIALEMGVTDGWWKYGCAAVIGIDTYGESAPAPVLFEHFGFTVENVVATVCAALKN